MTQNPSTISDDQMTDFLSSHRLPPGFRKVAEQHYLPLARRLPEYREGAAPLFLGINGAQGTGKSTLADFLGLASQSMFEWNVAVLSIDDFYRTRAERKQLSENVHPLLMTRGVPGTHDTDMLASCLQRLRRVGRDEKVALPRFDKAIDGRADESRWPVISGPVDLVILEGWCVATKAQPDNELLNPVNDLERNEDSHATWRHYVNNQLKANYAEIFEQLKMLVFLRAPNFDAIFRWRLEQEEKLAAVSPPDSSGLMSKREVERFLQYYERLTRANLALLPDIADVVFVLDEAHGIGCVSRY